ncbi:MAG: hypothetical protein ABI199_01900 [Bacteroidia bacterium]
MKKSLCFLFIGSIICLNFFSCKTDKHSKTEIESSLKQYDNLILKLDADSISMLYTNDGNLGNIAIGRDSIRKFLSSFKNVKVLSQQSISDSIKISRDTAFQTGHYAQTDLIAGKDTVKVKGTFTTRWQWVPQKGWQIKRMITKSI